MPTVDACRIATVCRAGQLLGKSSWTIPIQRRRENHAATTRAGYGSPCAPGPTAAPTSTCRIASSAFAVRDMTGSISHAHTRRCSITANVACMSGRTNRRPQTRSERPHRAMHSRGMRVGASSSALLAANPPHSKPGDEHRDCQHEDNDSGRNGHPREQKDACESDSREDQGQDDRVPLDQVHRMITSTRSSTCPCSESTAHHAQRCHPVV